MVKLLYWAGCTALAGENNYSRNPLPGSYLGSSEESGVYTFELQGICSDHAGTKVGLQVFTPLNCKGYAAKDTKVLMKI